MSTAYVVVTLLAAILVGASACGTLLRVKFVVQGFAAYGVPETWWPWLGAAKAAGALGLLAGLVVPIVGFMAGVCLIVYFMGAVTMIARSGWFTHIPVPLVYTAPVIGTLALGWSAGWPTVIV